MEYLLIGAKKENIEQLKYFKEDSIMRYANEISDDELKRIKKYIDNEVPKDLKKYKMVKIEDEIIGSLLIKDVENGVMLDEIYIIEKYRKKGIGSRILTEVLENNQLVYLWVYKNNIEAIKLYKKFGFTIIQETDSRFHMEYRK